MSGCLDGQRSQDQSADGLLTLICQPPAVVEASAAKVLEALAMLRRPSTDSADIAAALLALLSQPSFGRVKVKGRVLRHAVVEALLRLGDPLALQLEPSDVAALRRRSRSPARLVTLFSLASVVGSLVAVFAPIPVTVPAPSRPEVTLPTNEAGDTAHGQPCRHDDTSRMAVPVAHRVAELRRAGSLVVALAVAEACVVAFDTPGPCIEELLLLPPGSGDPERALYRRRQWVLLATEPGVVVRSRGRELLINDFAREASLIPAPNPLASQVLMKAVESWEALAVAGEGTTLAERVAGCLDLPDQNGVVCRSYLARAERLKQQAR